MSGRLVFLLEEPSMRLFLSGLLPRMFPGWVEGQQFLLLPHRGKSDLKASIPRKLRGWQIPGDRFVILCDNDNVSCANLKAQFVRQCAECGRSDTLIRLVCQELESWYLGDLQALAKVYEDEKLDSHGHRKRFRHPDNLQKPSVEVARLVPSFQKGDGARRMGDALRARQNTSGSFQAFVSGLEQKTTLSAQI